MTTKLLLPILNRNVNLFKGPTWYLSEKVSIETISMEDYGLIHSCIANEYQPLISSKSKCITVDNVDIDHSSDICRIEGTKIAFLLNYFKSLQPVALSFAVQITKRRKSHIDQFIDLPVVSDARLQRSHNYRIRGDVHRENISEFYKVISIVYEKHPGIILTLDRFNSALFRTGDFDKIIDITISLESLIKGTTELQHKFSLFNAWAAEPDHDNRKRCLDLLRLLYNARSAIVHGTDFSQKEYDKKIKPILDQWVDIIKITEKILGYHLLYLYVNDISRWYEHQMNLVLGVEGRIF